METNLVTKFSITNHQHLKLITDINDRNRLELNCSGINCNKTNNYLCNCFFLKAEKISFTPNQLIIRKNEKFKILNEKKKQIINVSKIDCKLITN